MASRALTKKTRRNSGRKYPYCPFPVKKLDEEGIVLEEYWDDWSDYRDSYRYHNCKKCGVRLTKNEKGYCFKHSNN